MYSYTKPKDHIHPTRKLMILRLASFLPVIFLFLFSHSAIAEGARQRHDITFVVRKADIAKNVAVRFHLSFRELKKLNPHLHKNDLAYQGKQLLIPVWMKPKGSAQKESTDFSNLDYELDMDSLDAYIKEDFLSVADIEADTVRRIAIDKQIKLVNRKISILNARMDSIEADRMQSVSNKEAMKVQIDRARHRGGFAIGDEIDTLALQKKKLIEEKGKINLRVAEYEYLLENAVYMSSHSAQEDAAEIKLNEPDPVPAPPARVRRGKK
jgi:hypothetical protein